MLLLFLKSKSKVFLFFLSLGEDVLSFEKTLEKEADLVFELVLAL